MLRTTLMLAATIAAAGFVVASRALPVQQLLLVSSDINKGGKAQQNMSAIQSGSPGNQCALPTKADKRVKGGASALSGGTRFRPSNMFGNQ